MHESLDTIGLKTSCGAQRQGHFTLKVLRGAAIAFFMAPLSRDSSVIAAEPPNVLFILADDVGREVLGCYDGVSYATPRIDTLAEQGIRFAHAYACPMCHPTRLTLLTGR